MTASGPAADCDVQRLKAREFYRLHGNPWLRTDCNTVQSIGMARFPRRPIAADLALAVAGKAMYGAATRGKILIDAVVNTKSGYIEPGITR